MSGKLLQGKAYGSIPHLVSAIGDPRKTIHSGVAAIMTKCVRDEHDLVVVQEKVNGTCFAVTRDLEGVVSAVNKRGYAVLSDRSESARRFFDWFRLNEQRFMSLLKPGERVVGAFDTGAATRSPAAFVVFDLMRDNERLPYPTFIQRVSEMKEPLASPRLIHKGSSISIHSALLKAGDAPGLIYRLERNGRVEHLAKHTDEDRA